MTLTTFINSGDISEINDSISRLCKSFRSIQKYANSDFSIVKRVLEQFKNSKEYSLAGSSLQDVFSSLIIDLQYIDVLSQRLDHTCNNLSKLSDRLNTKVGSDSGITAYWYLVKLSELQFSDAIRQYVASTEHIKEQLRLVIGQYKNVLPKVSDASYLYENNGTIRNAATQICKLHFNKLLKYRNSRFEPLKCAQELKDVCKSYTMKEERFIFNNFLKEEIGDSYGYDEDTEHESVSLF